MTESIQFHSFSHCFIHFDTEMSQTQNQSKYYYSPRFRHFNIYRRDPDGDTKVDDAATQEEAKRKVYELNGWNYKPKNNTVK